MIRFMGLSSAVAGLLLIGATLAGGTTLLVPDEYDTIQEAVDAAIWGDLILVGPGTYSDPTHEAGAGDTTKCCVIMKSGVRLRGAGMGQTFIDADSSGRGIHVYQCEEVQISRLSITGGYAEEYGGAILCKQSSPHIHHCEIFENWDGGIAVVDDSHPTIELCSIHDNHAKSGGGIEVLPGCEPYVYDCDIVENRAPFAAGVMLWGDATIEHCRIFRNRTTEEYVFGGGIYANECSPQILGCEIRENESRGYGGGLAIEGEGTTALIDRCLIVDNFSSGIDGYGGGIFISSQPSPTIRNSIIAGNYTSGQLSDGGGVYVQFSGLEMYNCTLYGNWTEGQYGEAGNLGVETSLYIPIPVTVSHSIIVSSPDGRGIYCTGTGDDPTIDCCDVFGNAGGDEICGAGTGNFSLDPLLCDTASENFHIEDASPCAPGNHPEGAEACGGLLIGAKRAGCDSGIEDPVLAGKVRLLGNRPNPFSGRTTIAFMLARQSEVNLEVLDASGRRIAVLHDGHLDAGLQEVGWDGRTLSGVRAESGVYFYRLRCGGVTQGMRMLNLR